MMAGMGFGQSALQHPELRQEHVRLMGLCIEQILSPQVKAFDREMWGNDAIETLEGDPHHAAYLGYLNVLLSLHRLLVPDSQYAALNDRITDALVRRIGASKIGLIESYPREVYPVDNCMVIGSIGLHARATGTDRRALVGKWAANFRQKYVDRATGLVYQCVDADSGEALDCARGSGTALAVYALSFADMTLSRELYQATRKQLARTVLGFGA